MTDHRESSKLDVILIGRKLPDNENLGIGYLLASLGRAGVRARMLVLNTWVDMEKIRAAVLEAAPLLVGLSIPDGGSSFLPLGMGELLRASGFRGHITAGGGFATLAREWLLSRYEWLDSVVRFAGEVPLTLLAGKIARGESDFGDVPGLTTRRGDGLPAPVMDRTQVEIFPVHGELPGIIGHGAAHMAATRGCPGRCAYCGPAALQKLERREGLGAGFGQRQLTCAGVGGARRRGLAGICDEMAELWHARGVRYFYFVDEHVLPRKEADALDFIHEWKKGLRRRGVDRPGIGCMLRADLITPAVAEAFSDLGLVRSFVGVEFASAGELKLYGRSGSPARGLRIMEMLEELDVATICNLMLVHPYSTAESIAGALDFLDAIGRIPFEATQMQVYHGTRLFERLRDEGRLLGNPIRYSTTPVDQAAGRFAEIFSRLRGEVFRDYSLAFNIHDVRLAAALAGRLHPDVRMDDLRSRCGDLTLRLNRLRAGALRRALELALEGKGFFDCDDLLEETRISAADVAREIEIVSRAIAGRLSRPAKMFAPMKAAAAAVFSFVLGGASVAGGCRCPAQPPCETPGAVDTPRTGCGQDAANAASQEEPARAPADAKGAGSEEPVPEAVADISKAEAPAPETVSSAKAKEPAAEPPAVNEALACSYEEHMAARKKAEKIVLKIDPCMGVEAYFRGSVESLTAEADDVYDARYCTPRQLKLDEIKAALRENMSKEEISCVGESLFYVQGKDTKEKVKLYTTAKKKCFKSGLTQDWYSVVIEVGPDGKVADVRARDEKSPPAPASIACIKKALKGLVFPCLAGYQICPEYVIIE